MFYTLIKHGFLTIILAKKVSKKIHHHYIHILISMQSAIFLQLPSLRSRLHEAVANSISPCNPVLWIYLRKM